MQLLAAPAYESGRWEWMIGVCQWMVNHSVSTNKDSGDPVSSFEFNEQKDQRFDQEKWSVFASAAFMQCTSLNHHRISEAPEPAQPGWAFDFEWLWEVWMRKCCLFWVGEVGMRTFDFWWLGEEAMGTVLFFVNGGSEDEKILFFDCWGLAGMRLLWLGKWGWNNLDFSWLGEGGVQHQIGFFTSYRTHSFYEFLLLWKRFYHTKHKCCEPEYDDFVLLVVL